MRDPGDGYWLGGFGGMVRLPDTAGGVEASRDDEANYTRLLGGSLVPHVASGRPVRRWSVDIPNCRPDETAPLMELLEADPYGVWWWVTPHARATNLLTPSMCDKPALVPGGMRPTTEGDRVVRSWMTGGTRLGIGDVPVVPGVPVTGSAYLSHAGGPAVLEVAFLDLSGAYLRTDRASVSVPSATLQRVHVTGLPPAGAVSARLIVDTATTFARPAVTWTTGPTEWGHGAGASAVHVSGWSSPLTHAVPDPASNLRLSDLSFTVQEVRDA